MKRIIVPTILTLVIGGSAWAVAPKGEYVGRFNYSCPQILKLHKNSGLEKVGAGVTFNRSFSVVIGWMAGYMSRVNRTRRGKADFYENMADEADWVANWCETHKKADLMEAMEALTKERITRPKKPEPPKAASSPAPGPRAPGPRAK